MGFEIPIAFCVFNRPELTQQVFDSIRRQQPDRLLLIADGPRDSHPTDKEKVKQVREIVANVDWPCAIKTNFATKNLGCRNRMASGIDWAFEHEEQLIILEDDCLPDDSFYSFCQDLLTRYQDCEEVMMISGDNFQPDRHSENSYYFSKWAHIWGWATWKRAWNHYDVEMAQWESDRGANLKYDSEEETAFWTSAFEQSHNRSIDTWDFAWQYAVWKNNGLVVLPESNLITNIGFGSDATHTLNPESKLACLPTQTIEHIKHPESISRNMAADHWTFENVFSPPQSKQGRAPKKRKSWLKRLLKVA